MRVLVSTQYFGVIYEELNVFARLLVVCCPLFTLFGLTSFRFNSLNIHVLKLTRDHAFNFSGIQADHSGHDYSLLPRVDIQHSWNLLSNICVWSEFSLWTSVKFHFSKIVNIFNILNIFVNWKLFTTCFTLIPPRKRKSRCFSSCFFLF